MVLGHFILFREGNIAKATYLKGGPAWPHTFKYSGRTYREANFQIPLYNHLLTAKRELAGFSCNLADKLLTSRLVRNSENIIDMGGDGSDLWFILANEPIEALHNDTCQAMAAIVYADGHGDHIIAVPDFDDWGKLWDAVGFPFAIENAPVPVKEV